MIWYAVRSVVGFLVILLGGTLAVSVLQSIFVPDHRTEPLQGGPPQKVASERATLKAGASLRYDLVFPADARVKVEVRAETVPVAVKLMSTPEPVSPAPARKSRKTSATSADSPSPPPLWQEAGVTVIHVEALKAGKWTVLIELADRRGARDRSATTITTELSVL